MMLRGDFHIHSNVSDGRHSPAVVVRNAAAAGIDILALTDHDTTDGFPEAQAEGSTSGLVVLCGAELSVTLEGREFHMLALGIDPDHPELQATLRRARHTRERRGETIVDRLAAAGAPISLERVLEIAGEGSIGRPHVAHALIEAGFARDVDDAFKRWLGRGRPGYVRIEYLDASDAIRIVHDAAGITSLAHPSLYREGVLLAARLAHEGLDAIEVVHPDVPPSDARELRRIAEERGLLITGGSDDHGFEGKECLGQSYLSGDDLDRLLQRIAGDQSR